MVWVEGSKEKTSVLATVSLTPFPAAPDVQVGMGMSCGAPNPANGVGVAACAGAVRSTVSNAALHRLNNTFLISAASYPCRESGARAWTAERLYGLNTGTLCTPRARSCHGIREPSPKEG